jgi:hypothetical protein
MVVVQASDGAGEFAEWLAADGRCSRAFRVLEPQQLAECALYKQALRCGVDQCRRVLEELWRLWKG